MGSSSFHFKHFSLRHDQCAMKVGTDGILLGAWADVTGTGRVLDIGTGCGLIALMVAQRNRFARIDAVEVDPQAAAQASDNFNQSPWPDRLHSVNESFAEFAKSKVKSCTTYDAILANLPYFQGHWPSPQPTRELARHSLELSLRLCITESAQLLSATGRLSLILPFDRLNEAVEISNACGLHCHRETIVLPLPHARPKRVLLEFSPLLKAIHTDHLIIETAKHQYSNAFRELTNDFYLNKASQFVAI